MLELLKNAEDLQEKQTWLRNNVQKWFELWADKTSCLGDITSVTMSIPLCVDDYQCYVKFGSKDCYVTDDYDVEHIYNTQYYFWKVCTIQELRDVIAGLEASLQDTITLLQIELGKNDGAIAVLTAMLPKAEAE